ncbi:MAG: branched-chain amino acid aminotransferase [Candidatus Marinimicrobia bacterium]|nr:branched-chain amino acid aminotransferase [Candidatus Neomarinimicrobiota bacterium]MBT3829599.1 branched-chain amino acid aminotransferase [Candidatus Neomarinimicrobiota bacterium]MBT3996728.1 branched-chain amino acid aminotransferase [Candidatus Neomarinimicrobiota bacterium]MBT4280402.1 branched-chain amino acid aminotransferase [Candidatus Neomarinimicrobiota bacterium]MBT4796558.1 branched-chain amino acid aminotransferase [Candidatus Neomarinimicrobiota bacterium]
MNPSSDINWDSLGFEFFPTRSMFRMDSNESGQWNNGGLIPFGELSFSPASGVLNYGQGAFEGTKAFRSVKDRIVLFRPDMNAERLGQSAKRLVMPKVEKIDFLSAVEMVVRDNADFIPPLGKGSLYIRPLLWGTGPVLGVRPAPTYTFIVFVTPVGSYFKNGVKPLKLKMTRNFHRAAPHGTGNAKAIGNYAASLFPLKLAKETGFDEVLYLHAADETQLEEVGSANVFIVKDNVIKTPRLSGSILPGITRNSVIRIARDILKLEVEETEITIKDLLAADEAFCTGTAVVVTPIGNITVEEDAHSISGGGEGKITAQLRKEIVGIQREERDDPFCWVHPVDKESNDEK